jgi:hypothetical protein
VITMTTWLLKDLAYRLGMTVWVRVLGQPTVAGLGPLFPLVSLPKPDPGIFGCRFRF